MIWIMLEINVIMWKRDSFKNFVDFQNRLFDFDSRLNLCDRFVLKRLVWSWMFVFWILALFFERHFRFCYLFFQFVYLLSDEWSFYIVVWLIFWLFYKWLDEILLCDKLMILLLFWIHCNHLNRINLWLFSVVCDILDILHQKCDFCL